MNSAPPPRRPSRYPFYATVASLSVIAGLLLGVGGFFGVRALQGQGESVASEEPTESPTVLTETPVGPEAAIPMGTAFPLDPEGTDGTVEVTLSLVDWEATERVLQANSLTDPPAAGNKYILLTVDSVYRGDGEFDVASGTWMQIQYAPEGQEPLRRTWVPTPRATVLMNQTEVTDGESFFDEAVFEVPEGTSGDGSFVITVVPQRVDEGVWVEAG